MGKVYTSPRLGANGHVELRYEDGDLCDAASGRTWASVIYMTCSRTVAEAAPLGAPSLVSVDNKTCEAVFHVPTILACNDTTK